MTSKAYYENVRGLRSKANEFMSAVVGENYTFICLTETWVEESISSGSYFTPGHAVFRRDRGYNRTGQRLGGGVLTAVDLSVNPTRRGDFESYDECVRVQESCGDGTSYLLGNYYFLLMYPPVLSLTISMNWKSVSTYLRNTVHVYDDFNVPNVGWRADGVAGSYGDAWIKGQ